MLTTFTTLVALGVASQQQTDTTLPVHPGVRLEVNNFGGEIDVKTWSKNAVRIEASHSSSSHPLIVASEGFVRVRSEGRRGLPNSIDYVITAPPWMALDLSGVNTEIKVDGVENEVTAETVQGDVTVLGGSGNISLQSVQGSVTLEKARGRVELNSVNADVKATDISGDLSAQTVNGAIELSDIESANTEATTVNGDISYDGTIKNGGRYHFSTHDGDLEIAVPEKANVSVSVSTFNGDFNTCFPVQLTGKTKHRFEFTIGSGSARLELESFDGDIKLCRPGQTAKGNAKDHEEEKE